MLMATINPLKMIKVYNGRRIIKKQMNLGLIYWLAIMKKLMISSSSKSELNVGSIWASIIEKSAIYFWVRICLGEVLSTTWAVILTFYLSDWMSFIYTKESVIDLNIDLVRYWNQMANAVVAAVGNFFYVQFS